MNWFDYIIYYSLNKWIRSNLKINSIQLIQYRWIDSFQSNPYLFNPFHCIVIHIFNLRNLIHIKKNK